VRQGWLYAQTIPVVHKDTHFTTSLIGDVYVFCFVGETTTSGAVQ